MACGGCQQTACVVRGRPLEINLPEWFTRPTTVAADDVPVDIGMRLPADLVPFHKQYGDLPPWVVYGVVRSLGFQEFVVTGVLRAFTLTEGVSENRVVLDTVRYNVSADRVEAVLADVMKAYAEAGDDRARIAYLGRHLRRRFGSYALFSMVGGQTAVEDANNLLMRSGVSGDQMETFTNATEGFDPLGWRETATECRLTLAGEFRYGDAMGSFRKVEEDAIHEMARSVLVSLSHMHRQLGEGVAMAGAVQEDVRREQLVLRMAGVRVLRRMVDLKEGACVVTVAVPKSGISRQ